MTPVAADDAPLRLASEFPPITAERWRASVDAVLARGKDLTPERLERLFTTVLTTSTDDGLVLRPLYTAATSAVPPPSLPGQQPFVRAATAAGTLPSGWDVRARVAASDPDPNAAALDELANGATSLWLDLRGSTVTARSVADLLVGVQLEMVALVLQADDPAAAAQALAAVWADRALPRDDQHGCLGFDPLGAAAVTGSTAAVSDGLAAATRAAGTVADSGGAVRALVADATPYHDAGASEADEVAAALATGVAYVRALVEAGLDVDAALEQVEFRLAATDAQFPTVAKLRAARLAWARVAQAWGASGRAGAMRQHAVTSRAMLTRHDVWVNLLRNTVAVFAAGVGGADAVTALPHDLRRQPSHAAADLARRLARNTQTILVEESHLGRVIDPAGGSWFVEDLTRGLAERAWARFQQIEAGGGMATALDSGLVAGWLEQTRAARAARVARRTQPITGVSEFPLLDEPVPAAVDTGAPGGGLRLHPYAEPFEALRDRAAVLGRPSVFVAALGPLAEHTARASFATNVFAAGGIRAVEAGTLTAADAAAAFTASGARLACIVGSNDRYATEAVEVARALASAQPSRLYLAGDPGALRADLDAAGVDDYLVLGGDAVAALDAALAALEVVR
jgi:methylmalonyl-CoA mutase